MELLLITACITLIKFCRDVKKQTWFLTGRNVISWLMKELFLDIRSLKEVLKLTETKLKQLRRCLVLGISKVSWEWSRQMLQSAASSRTRGKGGQPSAVRDEGGDTG